MSASQWASTRRVWVTHAKDVARGYHKKSARLIDLALRIVILALAAYSLFLVYCAACQEELREQFYALAETMLSAFSDAATGTRGSGPGTIVVVVAMAWLLTVLWMRRKETIYLVSFKTYRHHGIGGGPEDSAGEPVTYERFLAESRAAKHPDGSACFTDRSIEFQEKILRASAVGETSIFPPSIFRERVGQDGAAAERVSLCMRGAREESELMMFRAIEQLLESTGTRPEQVAILVVNCSLFCPTPSLSAMIVNKFGMRSNVDSCASMRLEIAVFIYSVSVISARVYLYGGGRFSHRYNLGGMGCSASVIAVDLAAKLLSGRDHADSLALVVSTENITQNWCAAHLQ